MKVTQPAAKKSRRQATFPRYRFSVVTLVGAATSNSHLFWEKFRSIIIRFLNVIGKNFGLLNRAHGCHPDGGFAPAALAGVIEQLLLSSWNSPAGDARYSIQHDAIATAPANLIWLRRTLAPEPSANWTGAHHTPTLISWTQIGCGRTAEQY